MKNLSLYVHIPFCLKKCLYCDFPSFDDAREEYETYVNKLVGEIKSYSAEYTGYKIKTIFIGGGTPTVIPSKFIGKIVDSILSGFELDNGCEITIEANPGTLNKAVINELKNMYINRVSLGLQAWQDKILKSLGRIHDSRAFVNNYWELREAGFDNINIDLMFSLPLQSISDWKETLINVMELSPEHISAYGLIIEEGTKMKKLFDEGAYSPVGDEADREMYYMAKELLALNGYGQYEISNFAREGKECKHNTVYWKTEEYAGFGLGAHSFINKTRYHNTYDFKKYLNDKIKPEEIERLSHKDQYAEFMFMGLRMTRGIEKEEFRKRFGITLEDVYFDVINRLENDCLVYNNDKNIRLTERGIDVSNYVFEKFLF